MYGGFIANGSIPTGKLEKVSDNYMLPDSTSIASSKAVYNLYRFCCRMLNLDPDTTKPDIGDLRISPNRYVYTAKEDGEEKISYEKLIFNVDRDHDIFVYRNGVRLFESIDYSMDTDKKTITLYIRTEQYEKIVFEYLVVERK